MIAVTLIRHGESTDNLRNVWAGWRDAPLSNHGSKPPGMNQAEALGTYFSATPFTAIHASPLKRAFCTAQALCDAQPTPKPPLTTSLLLREQHFGNGEGKSWVIRPPPGMSRDEQYAQGIFAILDSRFDRFPEGESQDDLSHRAEEAVRVIILPYVRQVAREGRKGNDVNVAIVSHGLCISEIVAALVRMDAEGQGKGRNFQGLQNTAWTRVVIDIKGAKQEEPLEFSNTNIPPLTVRVTNVNSHEHLNNVKRQKGIGAAAYDPNQADIRAFFGGGKAKAEAMKHDLRNGLDALELPVDT